MSDRVSLSLKEVAYRLGVSKAFLYLEVERGRLTTVKFGKRRLVTVADMNAYVAANREQRSAA